MNKRRVHLTDIERVISEHFFHCKNFEPEWFFEKSHINKELKLSGQEFDSIIESLINKKVLIKRSLRNGLKKKSLTKRKKLKL